MMPLTDVELLLIASALFLLSLLWILRRRACIKERSHLNIMGYELFYTDKKNGDRIKGVTYSTLLRSERFDISGKPDYIFKRRAGKELLPVELKSGTIGSLAMPRKNDLMQLCAYFIIIEDHYGVKPKKGRVVYSDFMFTIKNTRWLRNEVLQTVSDMRKMMKSGNYRVTPSFPLCKHCICKNTVCNHSK